MGDDPVSRRTALTATAVGVVGIVAGAGGATAARAGADDRIVADLMADRTSKTRGAVEVILDADRAAIDARLAYTTPRTLRIEAGVEGVDGTGQIDDSAAIQAILDSASRGSTIVFGLPGSSRYFRVDRTLTIRTGQLRVIGAGADHYSSSLHTNAPIAMLRVEASGVILDQVAFSANVDRGHEQATGVEFLGSDAADIDGHVLRCGFYKMRSGIVMRGKNLRVENSLFSSGRVGIYVGGPKEEFHQKFESRNLIAHANRFHGMGAGVDDADIFVSPEHAHVASQFNNNFFDYSSTRSQVAIVGSDAVQHARINMVGNSHHYVSGTAYRFDHARQCRVSSAQIFGTASVDGAAISLANSVEVEMSDVAVSDHQQGVSIVASKRSGLRGVTVSHNRSDGLVIGPGLDGLVLDGISAYGNGGWGITGERPTNAWSGMLNVYSNQLGDISPGLEL